MTPMPAPARFGSILRFIGPGLILTASIVGSGELIMTPKLAGEAGFELLWLIVLGCIIKVFVQVELGRYAICTGQTTLEALDSIPGPRWKVSWLVWLWILMFIALTFQVAGIVGGIAQVLGSAGFTMPGRLIALFVGGSCAVLLFFGRYRLVENLSTFMVVAFTLATLVALGALQWTDYRISAAQVISGFQFELPDKFATAFAAFGIIGVGASELIYYPYWCLEKGYGKYVGRNDGSAEWNTRVQGWLKVMRSDAWISMIIYTVATAAFYLLGAAVLHAKGLKVSDKGMIDTLARLYLDSFGTWSFYLFLFGAFNVLYSTAFVSTASNSRLLIDVAGLFRVLDLTRPGSREQAIKWGCIVLPAISTSLFLVWEKPVTLVQVGAVAQGVMLPFLAVAALYFRYRRIPGPALPGQAWTLCVWISVLATTAAGLYQIFDTLFKK
ncbi:MAG: divalent metal cation transporter [Verrucomicrobia bacterium]|nr:divalent metal cation transporter [Verrucomicrobiota bacterium]